MHNNERVAFACTTTLQRKDQTMHTLIEIFKRVVKVLLTPIRYIVDIWKPSQSIDELIKEAEGENQGLTPYPYTPLSTENANTRLNAEAAILFEDDRIVLTVEHDFKDMPSWVEGDIKTRNISVMMMGGGTVILDLPLPTGEIEKLENAKYLVFVTGTGPKKLMHNISFIYQG